MKEIDLSRKPAVLDTVDTFLAAVPWMKRRTVIIYLREHAGRRYVRLRTFNKHRVKDCWYPTKRYYMVPIESAERLGQAIVAASKGKPCGPQPEWWADFERQYAALLKEGRPNALVEPDTQDHANPPPHGLTQPTR